MDGRKLDVTDIGQTEAERGDGWTYAVDGRMDNGQMERGRTYQAGDRQRVDHQTPDDTSTWGMTGKRVHHIQWTDNGGGAQW